MRLKAVAAAAALAVVLSSCGAHESEAAFAQNPSRETARAPSISLIGPLTEKEEPTEPLPTAPPTEIPENTEPAAPEPPEETKMRDDFEMPPEFYSGMDKIVEKYGMNAGCDGTAECVCQPERANADGTAAERVMSVYYLDLKSGFEYELNPGAHYPIASTIKIPFCTLIYKKMTAGELDPEMILTYEERHYFKGSGVINQGNFGDEYTLQEVLTYAITRSDNTAYEMLKDLVTWEEFSGFLADAGCTHPEDLRQSKQKLCCESAGAYGRILADFLTSDSEYVGVFKDDLVNTRIKMLKSDWPIYRKYGWAGFSFHDIAYVDAPRPYVLAVMTNLEGEAAEDYSLFADISKLVESCSQNSAE